MRLFGFFFAGIALLFFVAELRVVRSQCSGPPDGHHYDDDHEPYEYDPNYGSKTAEEGSRLREGDTTVELEVDYGDVKEAPTSGLAGKVLRQRERDMWMKKVYFTLGTIIFAALCFHETIYKTVLRQQGTERSAEADSASAAKKKDVDDDDHGNTEAVSSDDDEFVDVKKPKSKKND